MSSGPYSPVNPDQTRVHITLAKVFVLSATLAVAAFTLGGLYADLRQKLLGIESRVNDLPTKGLMREEIQAASDTRVRELLRGATFYCPPPPSKGRSPTGWLECKATFSTK